MRLPSLPTILHNQVGNITEVAIAFNSWIFDLNLNLRYFRQVLCSWTYMPESDPVSGYFVKIIIFEGMQFWGKIGIGVQCMLACGRPPLAPTIDPRGGGAAGSGGNWGTRWGERGEELGEGRSREGRGSLLHRCPPWPTIPAHWAAHSAFPQIFVPTILLHFFFGCLLKC